MDISADIFNHEVLPCVLETGLVNDPADDVVWTVAWDKDNNLIVSSFFTPDNLIEAYKITVERLV